MAYNSHMDAFQPFLPDSISAPVPDNSPPAFQGDSAQGMMFLPSFTWNPYMMPFNSAQSEGFSACPPPLDFDNLPKFQELDWTTLCQAPFPTLFASDAEPQGKLLCKTNRVKNRPEVTVKSVGTLSQSERKLKILKYLEKRSRRSYAKRISYHCRKRVADQRLRVKGRFVTTQQAELLRGLENDKNNVQLVWPKYI